MVLHKNLMSASQKTRIKTLLSKISNIEQYLCQVFILIGKMFKKISIFIVDINRSLWINFIYRNGSHIKEIIQKEHNTVHT